MICLMMAAAPLSFGQAQYDTAPQAQTGEQVYGSYFKSELDSIGIFNGNLSMSISLFSLPGREIPMKVGFTYNSQKWEAQSCDDGAGPYDCGYYTGGWQLDLSPYGQMPTLYNGSIYWIDGSGTKRRYYSNGTISDNQSIPSADSDGTVFFTGTYWSTGDGSSAYISFPDGSRRYMSVLPAFATANGNTISPQVNGCSQMFTCGLPTEDTLGRTIQTSNGSNSVLYKITDSTGTLQTYTVGYTFQNDCDPFYEYVWWWPTWQGCWHYVSHQKISSITLPNGKSYLFEYDSSHNNGLGFMTKVTLPSGAYMRYIYAAPPSGTWPAYYDEVVQRFVSLDGTLNGEKTWSYSGYAGAGGGPTARTVTVTSPVGDKVVHQLNAQGLETQTQWQTSTGTTLKTVTSSWTQASVLSNGQPQNPQVNTITTILDGGEASQQTLTYDANMNVTQEKVTDWQWAATGPATIAEKDVTYTTIAVPNVTNVTRKSSEILTAIDPATGNFVQQGRTDYAYDEYSFMYTRSGVPSSTPPSSSSNLGNLTTTKRYKDASNFVSEHRHYDNLGNVVQKTDALNNTVNIDFTDNFCTLNGAGMCTNTSGHSTYAFPTQIANPLGQSASTKFDYNTGLPAVAIDARLNSTQTKYDLMNRVTSVTEPNSKVTSYSYDDTNRITTKTVTVDSSPNPGVVQTYFDQFYRVTETRTNDPEGQIAVDTVYDDKGRKTQVSNPYRFGSETPTWTTTMYDELDRPKQIQAPDSSSKGYVYTNAQTTVTDEAGNQRRYTHNAFGKLTMVEEPNPLLATPLITTYSYYVSGELYQSAQSGQTRTFVSNWLGQITSQTFPESGTTTFVYDADGNMSSKTDARPMSVIYCYDSLRRLTAKMYSGSCGSPGAGLVTIGYDAGIYAGLKTSMTDSIGTLNYDYDSMSRLTLETRTITGVSGTFTTGYGYNLKGDITSMTYPSGRVVNFTYATGNGCCNSRLASVVDQTSSTTVNSTMNYDAGGDPLNSTLGNGIVLSYVYNNRRQEMSIRAALSGMSLMDFSYNYGSSSTDTGRVLSRTDAIQPEHTASYSYDSVYRLAAVASGDSTTSWGIAWTFDVWGNRVAQTPLGIVASNIGSQTMGYTNNRNNSNTYDSAGNQTNDGLHNYTFNAENQIVSMDAGAATYAYDGDGNRMKKVTSSETTYTFYGRGGIISEFTTSNTIATKTQASTTGTDVYFYHTADRLESAVLVTTANGTIIENNRTLPFGEAWSSTDNGQPSTNDKKFTTYTRDEESGLDYAGNRYMANNYGRFQSPDQGKPHFYMPSSLNRYIYTADDPINFRDRTGKDICDDSWDFDLCDDDGGNGDDPYATATLGFTGAPDPGDPCFRNLFNSSYLFICVAGETGSFAIAALLIDNSVGPCPLERPAGHFTVNPNSATPIHAIFAPLMAAVLSQVFEYLNNEGIVPMITAGYRDPVLNAREGGSNNPLHPSWHLAGMAIDVNQKDPNFAEIKRVMQLAGLVWGGAYSKIEDHHFQLPNWGTGPSQYQIQACADQNSNAADDRGKTF
jgi:RHS repeat-associated protein